MLLKSTVRLHLASVTLKKVLMIQYSTNYGAQKVKVNTSGSLEILHIRKEFRSQQLLALSSNSIKISYIIFVHLCLLFYYIVGTVTWFYLINNFTYSLKPLSLSNCLQIFGKKEQL